MRRYIDRLHSVAGRGPGLCPGMAGRRERRRPAEALPLAQLRVWTTLFGPFTVAAWERQAPPRGLPSGATPPAERGGPGPFTPLRCPGLCEGSPAVTNPRRGCASLHLPPLDAAWLPGVGHGSRPCAATAQQPNPGGVAGARPPVGSVWGQTRGASVARHLVWGRGCWARSRRLWRCTGTAPAADPLGRIRWPDSIRGNRVCAGG